MICASVRLFLACASRSRATVCPCEFCGCGCAVPLLDFHFKVHSTNKFPTFKLFKSGINMFSDLLIKELVFRQNLGQGFHGSTCIAYGVSSVSTRLFPLFHHEPQHKRATILRPHKYNTVQKSNAKDSFLPSLWCPIRFGLRALPSLEDCQILPGSLGAK